MPDLKTVTFDATNHRALIERAIEIIQDGADSLRECSCCDGDWGDEEDAKQAYDIESAVAGELRAMLAAAPTPAAQSAGQEAIYQYQVPTISGWHDCDAEAFARISELEYVETRIVYAAPVNASEPVGVAGTMPGTEGFTMACFEAAKVPVGTSLYAAPVNAPLPDWFGTSYAPPEAAPVNGDERAIDLAIAFEQQRALSIVRAVRAQHFGSLNPDIPTQASAAFDLACEEIEHRLRTEQWQLDGIAAPLPAADAQQVNGDLHGEIMNIRCTEPEEYVDAAVRMAYRVGHRDARHAAAELVCMEKARAALTSTAKVGGDGREAFESAMRAKGKSVARAAEEYGGKYRFVEPQWEGWQARAALSTDGGEDKRDAERYRWLVERFVGYDFDWMPSEPDAADGASVAVFEIGREFRGSRDITASIDDHRAANQAANKGGEA